MYEVQAYRDANYLYICLKGTIQLPEAEEAVKAVIAEGRKLSVGFAIINDISEVRTKSPEVYDAIKRGQAALFGMGASKVIRVIGEQDVARASFAQTQREVNAIYECYIARTLHDAIKLLRSQRVVPSP